MKTFFISSLLATSVCLAQGQAVFVKFRVEQLSVNVAEGTTELVPKFVICKDTTGLNDTNYVAVKHLQFDDLDEISIEKMELQDLNQAPDFRQVDNYKLTTDTFNKNRKIDKDIEKGATYIYKLSGKDKKGTSSTLAYSVASVSLGNPLINCAKYNNVYRFSCHNCFQESVVSPQDGGLYHALNFTRVIELDIHIPPSIIREQVPGIWDVRHVGSGSKNNCGLGTLGDNILNICLDDIELWHNNHLGHDPITLFIDLKSDFNSTSHTPAHLDNLLAQKFGFAEIYKPSDFLGSHNNMRENALWHNWPTMGDLQNKFIFVLTGNEDRLQHYLNNRGNNAIAFVAPSCSNTSDVNFLPMMSSINKSKVTFYNSEFGLNSLQVTPLVSSPYNGTSRVWRSGFLWTPGDFSKEQYEMAIDTKVNHIAVGNISDRLFYDLYVEDELDGIQNYTEMANPILSNSHIYTSYPTSTHTAFETISMNNSTIHSGANYQLIAAERITLGANTRIEQGAKMKMAIGNCSEMANSTLREENQKIFSYKNLASYMEKLKSEPLTFLSLNSIHVFPSIASTFINIKFWEQIHDIVIIEFINIDGLTALKKELLPQIDNKQLALDIHDLSSGIYIIKITNNGSSYFKKFVKI